MQAIYIAKKLNFSIVETQQLLHIEKVAALSLDTVGVQFITRQDGIRQIVPNREIMPARKTMINLARKALNRPKISAKLTADNLFV